MAGRKKKVEVDVKDVSDTIEPEEAKEKEAEIILGYKIVDVSQFFNDKKTEYYIHKPTIGQESYFDSHYAECRGKLLRDSDAMARKEMEATLKKRGIDLDDLQAGIDRLDSKLGDIVSKIVAEKSEKTFDEEVIKELSEEKDKTKAERQEAWLDYENMFAGTIESLAEESKTFLKLVDLVKLPDGTKVWKDVEELKNASNDGLIRFVTNQALFFWAGVDPNFFDNWLDEIIGLAEQK